jgi:hypothetical protein
MTAEDVMAILEGLQAKYLNYDEPEHQTPDPNSPWPFK